MIFLSYLAVFFLGIIFALCAFIIFKFYQNWDAGVYPDLKPREKKQEPETDSASGPIIA